MTAIPEAQNDNAVQDAKKATAASAASAAGEAVLNLTPIEQMYTAPEPVQTTVEPAQTAQPALDTQALEPVSTPPPALGGQAAPASLGSYGFSADTASPYTPPLYFDGEPQELFKSPATQQLERVKLNLDNLSRISSGTPSQTRQQPLPDSITNLEQDWSYYLRHPFTRTPGTSAEGYTRIAPGIYSKTEDGILGGAFNWLFTPFRAGYGILADTQRGYYLARQYLADTPGGRMLNSYIDAVEAFSDNFKASALTPGKILQANFIPALAISKFIAEALAGDNGLDQAVSLFNQPNMFPETRREGSSGRFISMFPNLTAAVVGADLSAFGTAAQTRQGSDLSFSDPSTTEFLNPYAGTFLGWYNPITGEKVFDVEKFVQRGEIGYEWIQNLPRALGGGGGQPRITDEGLNRPWLESAYSFASSLAGMGTLAIGDALNPVNLLLDIPIDKAFEAISKTGVWRAAVSNFNNSRVGRIANTDINPFKAKVAPPTPTPPSPMEVLREQLEKSGKYTTEQIDDIIASTQEALNRRRTRPDLERLYAVVDNMPYYPTSPEHQRLYSVIDEMPDSSTLLDKTEFAERKARQTIRAVIEREFEASSVGNPVRMEDYPDRLTVKDLAELEGASPVAVRMVSSGDDTYLVPYFFEADTVVDELGTYTWNPVTKTLTAVGDDTAIDVYTFKRFTEDLGLYWDGDTKQFKMWSEADKTAAQVDAFEAERRGSTETAGDFIDYMADYIERQEVDTLTPDDLARLFNEAPPLTAEEARRLSQTRHSNKKVPVVSTGNTALDAVKEGKPVTKLVDNLGYEVVDVPSAYPDVTVGGEYVDVEKALQAFPSATVEDLINTPSVINDVPEAVPTQPADEVARIAAENQAFYDEVGYDPVAEAEALAAERRAAQSTQPPVAVEATKAPAPPQPPTTPVVPTASKPIGRSNRSDTVRQAENAIKQAEKTLDAVAEVQRAIDSGEWSTQYERRVRADAARMGIDHTMDLDSVVEAIEKSYEAFLDEFNPGNVTTAQLKAYLEAFGLQRFSKLRKADLIELVYAAYEDAYNVAIQSLDIDIDNVPVSLRDSAVQVKVDEFNQALKDKKRGKKSAADTEEAAQGVVAQITNEAIDDLDDSLPAYYTESFKNEQKIIDSVNAQKAERKAAEDAFYDKVFSRLNATKAEEVVHVADDAVQVSNMEAAIQPPQRVSTADVPKPTKPKQPSKPKQPADDLKRTAVSAATQASSIINNAESVFAEVANLAEQAGRASVFDALVADFREKAQSFITAMGAVKEAPTSDNLTTLLDAAREVTDVNVSIDSLREALQIGELPDIRLSRNIDDMADDSRSIEDIINELHEAAKASADRLAELEKLNEAVLADLERLDNAKQTELPPPENRGVNLKTSLTAATPEAALANATYYHYGVDNKEAYNAIMLGDSLVRELSDTAYRNFADLSDVQRLEFARLLGMERLDANYAKVKGLLNEINDSLRLRMPPYLLSIEDLLKAAELDSMLRTMFSPEYKGGELNIGGFAYNNFTQMSDFGVVLQKGPAIFVVPGLSEVNTVKTLTHEVGHIILFEAQNDMSNSLIKAVYDAYEATKSRGFVTYDIFDILVGEKVTHRLDKYPEGFVNYATDFHEWFAQQTAMWFQSSATPMTLVEKFFSGIAEKLKKMFMAFRDFFKSEDMREIMNMDVKAYLDSLVKNPREFYQVGEYSNAYLTAKSVLNSTRFLEHTLDEQIDNIFADSANSIHSLFIDDDDALPISVLYEQTTVSRQELYDYLLEKEARGEVVLHLAEPEDLAPYELADALVVCGQPVYAVGYAY